MSNYFLVVAAHVSHSLGWRDHSSALIDSFLFGFGQEAQLDFGGIKSG